MATITYKNATVTVEEQDGPYTQVPMDRLRPGDIIWSDDPTLGPSPLYTDGCVTLEPAMPLIVVDHNGHLLNRDKDAGDTYEHSSQSVLLVNLFTGELTIQWGDTALLARNISLPQKCRVTSTWLLLPDISDVVVTPCGDLVPLYQD